MREKTNDNEVIITSNTIKTAGVVFTVLSMVITSVFAFTKKADRQELQKLQTQVAGQQIKMATIEAKNNAIFEGIKEIKADLKEFRREVRKREGRK